MMPPTPISSGSGCAPASTPGSTPSSTAAPTSTPPLPRRRRMVLAGTILLLGGAMAAWWWLRPAPVTPPQTPDGVDAEVREALERAREDVLDAPASAEAWGDFGRLLLAHLFDREAVFCFVRAGQLDPTDPRWPYARALVARKRAPEEALALFRQALAISDGQPAYRSAVRLELAEALVQRGALDEAEELFRAEQEYRPKSARTALGLGMIAAGRGRWAEAGKLLLAARTSAYARKKATARLAAVALGSGDATAAAAYEKETAALPNDPAWPDPFLDPLLGLAVGRRGRERRIAALEREHQYAEAAALHLADLQEHPSVPSYIGAGINLARIRDYRQALPLLREAVRLAPENAQAEYTLALALFTRAELSLQSASAAQLKEWFAEAGAHARKAAELRTDHAAAYLLWGRSLKFLGRSAEAVGPLRKGVQCNPADFKLQFSLGEALLESNQLQAAETFLENARRLEPGHPAPVEALKQLRRLKKHGKATRTRP